METRDVDQISLVTNRQVWTVGWRRVTQWKLKYGFSEKELFLQFSQQFLAPVDI